ncbi:(d)CMP kinase [Aquifex pyrophilus]
MKIAIDGPSASGKSTIAKYISEKLGIPYLETGLVYRTLAYISVKENIPPENFEEVFKKSFEVIPEIGKTIVKIKGEELKENLLKTEEVGKRASELGAIPEFRERINKLFREIIDEKQMVVEGRDAGTHIIPEADVKIFITASPEERAKRRYEQLREMGIDISYEEVLQKILERDKRDMERPKYPFRPAEDAIIVDTTGMNIEEVFKKVMKIIYEHPEYSKHT